MNSEPVDPIAELANLEAWLDSGDRPAVPVPPALTGLFLLLEECDAEWKAAKVKP